MGFVVTFVTFTTAESKSLWKSFVNSSVLSHQLILGYGILVTGANTFT